MEKNRIHALRFGDTTRISYSRINEVLEMPNLIEVQKDSYQWFLKEGLKEVFEDISPITDFSGNLVLEFIDFTLDSEPKYSIEECKERDATYAAALKVKARLYNRELDELKEQEIFMGDFPLMTETAGTYWMSQKLRSKAAAPTNIRPFRMKVRNVGMYWKGN